MNRRKVRETRKNIAASAIYKKLMGYAAKLPAFDAHFHHLDKNILVLVPACVGSHTHGSHHRIYLIANLVKSRLGINT